MVFGEDKGFAACGQGIAVALFEGLGSFATRHAEVLDRNWQIGAGRQAYKIQGVGSRPGFVEVIHAPNQTALLVAPCTEVFDVKVADSEHGGSFRDVGADFRPKLDPDRKSGGEGAKAELRSGER